MEVQERKRPAVSREEGEVVCVVDAGCIGEALVRTARSMEIRRTVFGEGPRVSAGRFMVR